MRIARWVCLLVGLLGIGGGTYLESLREYTQPIGPRYPSQLKVSRDEIEALAKDLRAYESAKGEYPTNDQGLIAAYAYAESMRNTADGHVPPGPFTRYLDRGERRVTDAAILSLWGEPFIYENRRRLDADKFAGSEAHPGMDPGVGMAVDKRIYIWSIGAAQYLRAYEKQVREDKAEAKRYGREAAGWAVIGLMGLAAYTVITILRVRSGAMRRTRAAVGIPVIGAAVALLAAHILAPGTGMISCYAPSPPGIMHRSADAQAQSAALIAKYHERGVISDETYRKLAAADKQGGESGE